MKIDVDKMDEAYATLPENIQAVLDSKETAIIISKIGKKYALHIDQLGKLAIVVRAVLSGLVSRQDFLSQVKEETGLSEDQLNLVVYDLNQEIFSKIREELAQTGEMAGKSSPQQMFDEKMRGVSNVPKEEVEVKAETGDNKNEEMPATPAPRDPYRESI